MKWYKHDPAAALEGFIGLNAEERGFYITLIDLIYARAPHGFVTDELVVKAMACRPQVWRRVKARLMAKGKVREIDGRLMANRVETTLESAAKLTANLHRIGAVTEQRWAEIRYLTNGRRKPPSP